ncbi:MAG: hypothetical protein R3E32_25285 [Chitinophagales bacterium]
MSSTNYLKIIGTITPILVAYERDLQSFNEPIELIEQLNGVESFSELIASFDSHRQIFTDELIRIQPLMSPKLISSWIWFLGYASNQQHYQEQTVQEEGEKLDTMEEEVEEEIENQELQEGNFGSVGKLMEFLKNFKSDLTYANAVLKIIGILFNRIQQNHIYQKAISITDRVNQILEHKLSTLYYALKIDKKAEWFKACREKHKWLDRIVRVSFTVLLVLFGLWVISNGLHLLKTPYKFVLKMVKGHLDVFDDDAFL